MKKSEKNRATKKRENFQNGCQSENLQNTDKWLFLQEKKHWQKSVLFQVPVIGVEPIRYRYRGILSPVRLPIPPHRRKEDYFMYYKDDVAFCQYIFWKKLDFFQIIFLSLLMIIER